MFGLVQIIYTLPINPYREANYHYDLNLSPHYLNVGRSPLELFMLMMTIKELFWKI